MATLPRMTINRAIQCPVIWKQPVMKAVSHHKVSVLAPVPALTIPRWVRRHLQMPLCMAEIAALLTPIPLMTISQVAIILSQVLAAQTISCRIILDRLSISTSLRHLAAAVRPRLPSSWSRLLLHRLHLNIKATIKCNKAIKRHNTKVATHRKSRLQASHPPQVPLTAEPN